MRMKTLLMALLPLGLLGCQTLGENEFSSASGLELAQPLTIGKGSARVFIQNGKIAGSGAPGAYQPHCNFEVRELGNGGNAIEPDQFRITRVQWVTDTVVMAQPRHYAAASFGDVGGIGIHIATGMSGDASPEMVQEGYHFWLESAKQPDVMRLTCHGTRDDLGQAEPPKRVEIDEALGDIARIVY